MKFEDIEKAEKIIEEFSNQTRPMSTEESDLVDRYREYEQNVIVWRDRTIMGMPMHE